MDANRPPALSRTLPLALVCVLVAVAGTAWQAWDTLGGKGRSLLQGWDDSFYYFWLPSVVIDRDLDFSNQLTQAESVQPNARHDALTMPRTETGFVANKYPPGWALGSLPFFLAAHAIAPRGATGFEPIYQLSVWFGQLLYAALGLWFAIKILERFFAPRIAAGAVFVGWLASPLVYYQSARLSMSHSQVFVLAVAAFWLAFRIADGNARARHWALAGVVAAMLVVTRNIAAVYLVMPAWLAVPKLRSARAIAALLAGAAGPLLVQLVCWRVLYGDWFAYSYGGERFDFAHLHLIEILFSPLHGWFYWHPLLLPAIGAFVLWAVRHTAGRAWLVSLVTMIVLSAAWPTWWLGSSFGFRGLEVATFFAMVGFGWLFSFAATHTYFRRMVAAVVTLGVIWNLALFALFLTQRIPRQEPVTYGDAARAFVTWVRDAR